MPYLAPLGGEFFFFHFMFDVVQVDFLQVHVSGYGPHIASSGFQRDFLERCLVEFGEHHLPLGVLFESGPAWFRIWDGGAGFGSDTDGEYLGSF